MTRLATSFALTTLLCLGACSAPPPAPPSFPDIRFTSEPPIALDVSSIGLYGTFQPSNQLPEIDDQFAVPPVTAIQNWVHDRLIAGNPTSTAIARVTISDASVRQVTLTPTTTGIENMFTKEQAYRYDGHAAMKIELYDKGVLVRTAEADASLSRSIAEGSTLNDREQLWYTMSHDLTEALGNTLAARIQSNFLPYVMAR